MSKERPPGRPPDDYLAARLATAARLLAATGLAPADKARLQRRFTAICDAMKVPGADAGRCARRLDSLVAELRKSGLS